MKIINKLALLSSILIFSPVIFSELNAANKTAASSLPIKFSPEVIGQMTVPPGTSFELILQSTPGVPTLPFTVSLNSSYLSLSGGTCTQAPGTLSQPVINSGATCTLNIKVASSTPSGQLNSSIEINYNGRGIKPNLQTDLTASLTVNATPPTLYGVTGDGSGSPSESLFTFNTTTANATFFMNFGNGDDGEAIASDGNNFYHWSGYSDLIYEQVNLNNKTVAPITYSGSPLSEIAGVTFYKANNAFLVFDINSDFATQSIDGNTSSIIYSYPDSLKGLACYQHRIYTMSLGTPASIIELNPETGAEINKVGVTLTGFTVKGSTGIAINPSTGVFYALLKVQGSTSRKLVTLDPATGIATLLGDADDGSGGLKFASIAFHPADHLC